jgi:hypothetical protein
MTAGHDDERDAAEVRRLPTEVVGPYPGVMARPGSPPGRSRADGAEDAVMGFAPQLDSAREARHFVLSQLGSPADRALASDAAIVIAELAANAVLHARSSFTVAVSHPRNAVRIAVRDLAPLEDGERLVTATGHGLDVVAKIAARWAVEPLPDGKVIWAELSRGERLLS